MKQFYLLLALCITQALHAQLYEWSAHMGGLSIEEPQDVLIDTTDNSIYLAGFFFDTFDFDPDGGMPVTAQGSADAAIIKLDANGTFLWATQLAGFDSEMATKLAIDDQQNVLVVVNNDPKLNVYKFQGNNGNLVWYYSSDTSDQANGYGITLDEENNVYISGTYSDSVDFDDTANSDWLVSEGNEDGFVLKLDDNGNYVWAKSFGDNFGGALFRDIEWHPNNQLYVSGFFYGQVDFDPSSGTSFLNGIGSTDAFALKLDTAGNYIWAKQMGGPSSIQCTGLAIDDSGDLILVGEYMGSISLDPNSSAADSTENGGGDFYVQKLDTNGNLLWGISIGGPAYDQAEGVDIDANGNVYVTGRFSEVVDFDPSTAEDELDAATAADAFVLKFTENGDYGWALPVSSNLGFNSGKDVTIDGDNQLVFTGIYSDLSDLDPTGGSDLSNTVDLYDWFVIKLDLNYSVGITTASKQFNIFPNPSKGQLNIQSPINGSFKLYDISGKLIITTTIHKGMQQMDLNYPSGFYMIELSNDSEQMIQKLRLY